MPVKYWFCQRRDLRSGAYKKDLRILHANLKIVLQSTTENLMNDFKRDIYNANDLSERSYCYYESEPENHPAVYKHDEIPNMTMNESNTKALEENT